MATTPIQLRNLLAPVAPRLPNAPPQYDYRYQDEHSNVLRLYFNQLDTAFAGLLSGQGGRFLRFPHVAASYDDDQYATASNTPTIVKWNTLDSGNGMTLNANNTATAQYAGIYKITYSLEIANTDNVSHDVIVWLRVNGDTSASDVANSTTIFTLPARKSAGVPSYICGYSEVVFTLNAGDSVGLWWGTEQAATSGGGLGIYLYHLGAQTTPMPYPSTPSAIGSITFVSGLPA